MPIYEYVCPGCKTEFELMRPMSQADNPAFCPKCKSQSERLLSVFASTADSSIKVPDKGPFRKKS
jgi:putative FmdB family regulatory protein